MPIVPAQNGHYQGAAYGINNAGLVVGVSATTNCFNWHAALWNGTTPTDLNTFLSASEVSAGWVLVSASGVNDNGWIVGDAENSITGQEHAFVLTAVPVPEPQSYALALAGFGVVGLTARRRRRVN